MSSRGFLGVGQRSTVAHTPENNGEILTRAPDAEAADRTQRIVIGTVAAYGASGRWLAALQQCSCPSWPRQPQRYRPGCTNRAHARPTAPTHTHRPRQGTDGR